MSSKAECSYGVWVQFWEESERGWGVRPDGCWLYPTEQAAIDGTAQRLKSVRENDRKLYGNVVPDEYSRPSGTPQFKPVSAELAQKVIEEKEVFQQRFNGDWRWRSLIGPEAEERCWERMCKSFHDKIADVLGLPQEPMPGFEPMLAKIKQLMSGAAPAVSTPRLGLHSRAMDLCNKLGIHDADKRAEIVLALHETVTAVSTPLCPTRQEINEWLWANRFKLSFDTAQYGEQVADLFELFVRQFFQPAPLPQPSPQCPQCKSPGVGINYAIMFAECYSCGHKSRDEAGVEKFWPAAPSPQGENK